MKASGKMNSDNTMWCIIAVIAFLFVIWIVIRLFRKNNEYFSSGYDHIGKPSNSGISCSGQIDCPSDLKCGCFPQNQGNCDKTCWRPSKVLSEEL